MAPSCGSAFEDVDNHPDADALGRFLEDVRTVPAVAEAKAESLALCGLRPGDRVLDVGCGTGEDVLALAASLGPGGSAIGVDPSERFIRRAGAAAAASGSPVVSFRRAEASSLPFSTGHFDACRADRVLQHIREADRALAEMVRVTRRGGLVVISEMMSRLSDSESTTGAVATAIFDPRWTRRERRGWIAPLLPLIMVQAGLDEISIVSRQAEVTSFSEAAQILDLAVLGRAAVQATAISEAAWVEWRAGIVRAFSEGTVKLDCEFFHITGVKPTQSGGGG